MVVRITEPSIQTEGFKKVLPAPRFRKKLVVLVAATNPVGVAPIPIILIIVPNRWTHTLDHHTKMVLSLQTYHMLKEKS